MFRRMIGRRFWIGFAAGVVAVRITRRVGRYIDAHNRTGDEWAVP